MKLLTHNLLQCNVKQCHQFPLDLHIEQMEQVEAAYNEAFMQHILDRIDYAVVQSIALQLNVAIAETKEACSLEQLHHLLLQVEVQQGNMTCSKCKHVFTITDGIPNMLLNPNEV